jgi:hypothetical protein
MEKAVIKELERALKQARDKMLSYTDEELTIIQNLIAAATHATSLEVYSRELEAMKVKTPELV